MAIAVASLVIAIPLPCQSRGTSRVSVSFLPPSEGVTLHEPVLLEFSIRNGLREPIQFDLGLNRNSRFIYAIVDPQGVTHRVGPLRETGFGAIGKITLPAGRTFSEKLLLDVWFQFPQPGEYSVKPELAFSVQRAGGNAVPVGAPSPLSVNVEPRDAKRLEAVCDRLAEAAISPDAAKALEAAAALSYVVDPIAVPFLAKVTRRDELLRYAAVEGLGRVADAYGLDAVLSALGPDRAALERDVRAALWSLHHRVTVED
jgi:hypothetical protein